MTEPERPHQSRADFAPLGDVEFGDIPALFGWCEAARTITSNSGLIVVQAAWDINTALSTIAAIDGKSAAIRARRVARHAKRAGEHLHAAQVCFAKLPRAFLTEYQDAIAAHRRQSRKPFNVQGA